MIGSIAVVLVLIAPALLFLGWLALLGIRQLDEIRLLRPSTRSSM